MLRTLLESGATPTRRVGGTIVSVAVHTAAIALGLVATARATAVTLTDDTPHHAIVYQVLPTHTDASANHASGKPDRSIKHGLWPRQFSLIVHE